MRKLQNDLVKACQSQDITTWNEIRDYAKQFKKYNSLTLREIDEVYEQLNSF